MRSLTSIMSTTGKRSVGWQNPTLLPALLAGPRPEPRGVRPDQHGVLEADRLAELPADRRSGCSSAPEETFDRGVSRAGIMRQMMAVLTQPNRAARLRGVQVPTLVVHGLADKMVHVSGGRATAAAIPGAELLLIDGMGHDIPPAAVPDLRRRHPAYGRPGRASP